MLLILFFMFHTHHEVFDLVICLTIIDHVLRLNSALLGMIDRDAVHHNHVISIEITRHSLLIDVRWLTLHGGCHEIVTEWTSANIACSKSR